MHAEPKASAPRTWVAVGLAVITALFVGLHAAFGFLGSGDAGQASGRSDGEGPRVTLDRVLSDLGETSAKAGDLLLVEPERLLFRRVGALRIVCERSDTGSLVLRSVGDDSPLEGDSVLALVSPTPEAPARLRAHRVMSIDRGRCPDGVKGWEIELEGLDPTSTVVEGAPVRSFTIAELARTRIGADWYLALRLDGASPQPVSAPLSSPTPDSPLFRYLDDSGFPASTSQDVSVVEILALGPAPAGETITPAVLARVSPRS